MNTSVSCTLHLCPKNLLLLAKALLYIRQPLDVLAVNYHIFSIYKMRRCHVLSFYIRPKVRCFFYCEQGENNAPYPFPFRGLLVGFLVLVLFFSLSRRLWRRLNRYLACISLVCPMVRFLWGSYHDGWHTKGNILVSYSSYLLISCITKTFVYDALILLPTHTSAYARTLKCCTTHQPHRKSMQSKQ